MKTIKRNLMFAIVLLISTTTAIAQKKEFTDAQKEKMEAQLKTHSEKLNLSEVQKSTFKKITKKYALQLMALKESDKGKLSKYKEFKAIKKAKNKEMKAILSSDQYLVYEKTQEELEKKMKEKQRE